MLAFARAMGETAPLLLTALGNDLFIELNPTKRMSTLSLQIFGNAITGFRAAQARAWAGALTLVLIVLSVSYTHLSIPPKFRLIPVASSKAVNIGNKKLAGNDASTCTTG